MSGWLVSEVFGPTIQGEGPSTGQRCVFIRLGGCNLACSWCDTPYTWAFGQKAAKHHSGVKYDPKQELTMIPGEEVVARARDLLGQLPGIIVLSGGEPMLQQKKLLPWIDHLGPHLEIETAGTIRPMETLIDHPYVHFNVSPKLYHSGNMWTDRMNVDALDDFCNARANFKFVVRHADERDMGSDLREIDDIVSINGIPRTRVWIMPVGTTVEEVMSGTTKLADAAIVRGYNLTTRLHTLIWGAERGH